MFAATATVAEFFRRGRAGWTEVDGGAASAIVPPADDRSDKNGGGKSTCPMGYGGATKTGAVAGGGGRRRAADADAAARAGENRLKALLDSCPTAIDGFLSYECECDTLGVVRKLRRVHHPRCPPLSHPSSD